MSKEKRGQSAMEYLMTYGWVVLIIAVALGALYQLGVFNSGTYAQKAQPGSCQVIRPNGQYTSGLISTQGQCGNQPPQFVASLVATNAYLSFGNNIAFGPSKAGNQNAEFSLCLWYNVQDLTGYGGLGMKAKQSPSSGSRWEYYIDSPNAQGYWIEISNTWNYSISSYSTGSKPTAKKWYFSCFTYSDFSQTSYYYLNGVQHSGGYWIAGLQSYGRPQPGTGNVVLGAGMSGYSNVLVSNLQMYNASLSANEIKSLYAEGMGGAPIQLNNLVGWWPLNGNLNDYSGDNRNGIGTNVAYMSS